MNDSKKLGWVRFYRQSMDSSVWKNPTIWFVWSWCLLKANHETTQFPFNGNDILIKRGSFISGIFSAQKELPTLSTQNIRTAFNYLKSTGRITITSTNKFSIITIVKYNDFQDNNTQTNKPLTNHSQATNKPLTTNNNDNNVNNEKEGLFNESIPSKTYKGFRDQRRIESGRPPMTPRKSTEKQKAFMAAAKTGIDYFKAQGQEQHGMQFLEYTNDKRNAIVLKLVMNAYEKIGDLKELIDWWFQGEGEWADYEPERCFSIKTIERFKNKQPKQKRGFIINKQNE